MKLGTQVKDKSTGLKVTLLTLIVSSMDNKVRQIHVQPYALNPETKQPVEGYWTTEERLGIEVEDDLPYYLIGKEALDTATGFKGTVTSLVIHINGCVHANLQPSGTQKNGNKIEELNVDIRRLKGKYLTPLSGLELEKSRKEKPSPETFHRPVPKI